MTNCKSSKIGKWAKHVLLKALDPSPHFVSDTLLDLRAYSHLYVSLQGKLLRKTKIVDARTEGFDFLGLQFRGRLRLPWKKSLDKFKDALRAKTRRTRGTSLEHSIIPSLNSHLRGWFAYFRHCHRNVYTDLDGWLRGRCRSLLRKPQGKEGQGRGSEHQRWPNDFFTAKQFFGLGGL
jgi:hypothetical protein